MTENKKVKTHLSATQGQRVLKNLRLMLTFIDSNIDPSITEPNREGRMALARQELHRAGADGSGHAAFALSGLMHFVTENYTGTANVVIDAMEVLCELGLMHKTVEAVGPGHPLYGRTDTMPGDIIMGGDRNRRRNLEVVARSEALLRVREGMVRDGILEWSGAMRNGEKVWQLTEKGHGEPLWAEVWRKASAEGGSRDTMIDRALLYFLKAGGKIENIPE